MWKFVALLALISAPAVLSADCPSFNADSSTDTKSKLFKGQQIFTVNFLRELLKENSDKNVFFSPYSVYRALLLAYMGSKNKSEQSLHNALNLHWSQNKEEVISAYMSDKLKRLEAAKMEKSIEFESADKFYFSKDVSLDQCLEKTFSDEIEKLDFSAPAEAVKQINKWVENVTRDQIKDLLSLDALDPEAKLVLANAAYFKGLWKSKFDEEDTTKENFYVKDDKIKIVDMMRQEGRFSVSANEALGCHVLEMPYNSTAEGKGVSFIVFLPPVVSTIDSVLAKITPDTLAQALQDGHSQQVDLRLPRITMEYETELVPVLENLGLSNVFNGETDFSGFSTDSKISFNSAIHKAKIEIDEAGSKAAAATAMFMFRSSRPSEPLPIYCNHPFLFMIYDHKTRAILFSGVYRGPEDK